MAYDIHRYDEFIGKQFGYLTPVRFFQKETSGEVRTFCVCKCKCGKIHEVMWKFVRNGSSTSCGCRFVHNLNKNNHLLYNKWKQMNMRCRRDKYYRGRVCVCEEWIHNPITFVEWAKRNGWKKGLELDRIDNEKGYSPDNCRWVTHKENCRNKRNNHLVKIEGNVVCLQEASEITKKERHTLLRHLEKEKNAY